MKNFLLLIFILGFFTQSLLAQLPNASRELMHTQTAKTFNKGLLTVYTDMNFFTKAGDFIGQTTPQDFKIVNYWLVAGDAVVGYGITDHFDAALGIRVYQDTHYSNEFNLPDDLFLTLRAGSFRFGQGHFNAALMTSMRFPVGEVHNYPFAEYASGAFEFGFLSAVSLYVDPYLPERSFNMHMNMGFWNHNEAGKTLYTYSQNFDGHQKGDKLVADVSSKDFRMALAAVFPSDMFDFRMELSGILYITKPDNFVYSAEEWAFFSPSIRYKPLDWISMDLGMDFRLSPADRQSTGDMIPDISHSVDMPPNYPSWRVHLGANLALDLAKGKGKRTIRDYEREQAAEQLEVVKSVMDEKEKAQKAQEEIESLRKVRKEAEKEIEELKKMLEE